MQPMPALVYFDTDCFHHLASTFACHPLQDDLRDKILFSPVTMMEVLSHLAREWGASVHKQLRGLHNWVVTGHALVLPWMESAISQIGFGIVQEDEEYTKNLQADLHACVSSQLSELRDVAKARDSQLLQVKQTYAKYFQDTVDYFRSTGLTEEVFTVVWLKGLTRRAGLKSATRPVAQVVAALSALHEFEYNKLIMALGDRRYNAQKHRNDLFDAEQLIYLGNPSLHFLTVDRGYLPKITKSPQRKRVHEVPVTLLADARRAEILLRQITTEAHAG